MSTYLSPSPSAISLTILCPARACGRYVHGIKDVFGPSAQKGVLGHSLVQTYLQTGELPNRAHPLNAAVRAMIAILPVGAAQVEPRNIERSLLLQHNGVEYTGYIDWEHKHLHGDLKFTSNPSRFASIDPYTDPQRIVYAADWFSRHHGENTATSIWTAASFDGRQARAFKKQLKRKKIKKALDAVIEPAVYRLLEMTARQLDWQTQPKNASACNLYPPHGCPMRKHGCKPPLRDQLTAIKPKPTLIKRILENG